MKKFRLIAALLPLMLLTSCGGNKLEQAFYDTAVALNSTTKVIIAIHHQGLIDDEAHADILKSLQPIAQIHKEAVRFVKAADKIDSANTPAILSYLDNMATALVNLQAVGALRIKDINAQRTFAASILTTRTALVTLRAIIAGLKVPQRVNIGKAVTA